MPDPQGRPLQGSATSDGSARQPPKTAHEAPPSRLDEILAEQTTFRQAQGALAERSGGSLARAGQVLVTLGAQLGMGGGEAVGTFFLSCLEELAGDPQSQRLVNRLTVSAGPAGGRHRANGSSPAGPGDERSRSQGQFEAARTVELATGLGVAVHGELDIATAPLLAARMSAHLRLAGQQSAVVLDLHDLTFCDVAGLRALEAVHQQVTATGARLRVVPPAALAPRRLLHFAVSREWSPAEFAPGADSPA